MSPFPYYLADAWEFSDNDGWSQYGFLMPDTRDLILHGADISEAIDWLQDHEITIEAFKLISGDNTAIVFRFTTEADAVAFKLTFGELDQREMWLPEPVPASV